MSKFYYTSKELIESVKRRIMMPTTQSSFTDQDLLDFATEEVNMAMVPMIQNQQEDYFLITQKRPLVSGVNRYEIPYRATGNKLREVSYSRDNNSDIFEMTRINIGDMPFFNQNQYSSSIQAFYVENNEIVLVNQTGNSLSGSLNMSYYIRPNTMVPLEDVAVIRSYNPSTGEFVLEDIPEKFLKPNGTFVEDLFFDIISTKSPHKHLGFDISFISGDLSSMTIIVDPANITHTVNKGDHLTIATETAIPQIPSDLHVMLAHRVATRCLEALGDTEGLQNANQKLAEFQQAAKDMIDNRVENASKKVVPRHGVLRNGLTRRYFRRR